MADINITADFTEINNLNNTLKSTDTLFVKVVNSLLQESKRAERVTKVLANTTQKNLDIINKAESIVSAKLQQESDKREKARIREAVSAEKEAQRIIAANDKIAKSEAKLADEIARNQAASAQKSTAGLNQRVGITGTPAIGAGAGFSAIETQIERLRLKYDQIYASSQLYQNSLAELNTAHMLGAISSKKHESAVESLNQEYQNFQNGVQQVGNRFSQHINQTSNGMNKFGVAVQQAGYQAGDFLVQIQSGTNFFVAFGQQATQLIGILPMFSAELGVSALALSSITLGLSIAIPLVTALGAFFMRTGKDAKDVANGPMKVVEDRITSLNSSLEDYLLTKKAASLGVTKDELISTTGLDAAMAALDAADKKLKDIQEKSLAPVKGIGPGADLGISIYNLFQDALGAEDDLTAATKARADAAELVRKVEEKTNDAYQKQYDLLFRNNDLELAKVNLGENSLAFKEKEAEVARRDYADQLRASGDLNDTQIAGLVALKKAQEDALQARKAELAVGKGLVAYSSALLSYLRESKVEAENLRRLDFSAGIAAAAAAAQTLASNLGVSLSAARGIVALGNGKAAHGAEIYDPRSPNYIPGASTFAAISSGPHPISTYGQPTSPVSSGGAGGSGGGSSTKDTQTAIEKLQEQLAIEKELLGISEAYQKVRSALGEDFKTTSPVVIAGLVAEAEQVQKLIDLDNQRKQLLDSVKSSIEDGLMSMVDGTKSVKDAFKSMAADIIKELYRVLVVQRLVNAVSGFFMPAATPTTPPGLATGGSMMANRAYMVGENGPELVIPRHSGTVVNSSQTARTGNSSGNFTQNLSINVTGSDSAMVRTEIAKMIPQITNATKAAVIDAKQRGGQMAAAFR